MLIIDTDFSLMIVVEDIRLYWAELSKIVIGLRGIERQQSSTWQLVLAAGFRRVWRAGSHYKISVVGA